MKASQNYKEHEIASASQGRLIVMMYEGAVRFLRDAVEAIQARRLDKANEKLIKAQDVIHELSLALNFDAGDISQQLFSLYSYMNRKLVEANVNKDIPPIQEVIDHLESLLNGWREAARNEDGGGNPVRSFDVST